MFVACFAILQVAVLHGHAAANKQHDQRFEIGEEVNVQRFPGHWRTGRVAAHSYSRQESYLIKFEPSVSGQ